ncbi:hypothetical protein HW532_17425 [Kaustia mangrovi]|uniref:Type III secretion protein n=1 Tax=Kaustia mangrovi TaxID=2593653 RepID=A0A7S8C6K1_9HYPH|nr:hypothetical protein [Kaustia mangrovi]QPC44321.1 hypothetical protein HW532_17425 [Kaustia mangrovi]
MRDFSQIVALRQRRLDRMVKAESAEKAAVAQADQACEAAQKAIDDYLEETRTLEIDLLTALLNKRVSVNDLLAVEETLEKTKQKAQELADRREACRTRLAEARERARIVRRERVRSALKLNKSEHIESHLLDERRKAETRAEDAALDEFSEQMAARACGGGGHDT